MITQYIMTQHYELMFIIPGSISEDQVPAMQERVLQLVKDFGGVFGSQYNMQRRRLAYKIKQQTFGYYYVAQFDMEAEKVLELDTKLRLDNDILRHMVVKAMPRTEEVLRSMLEIVQPVQDPMATEVDDVAKALPAEETSVASNVGVVSKEISEPVITNDEAIKDEPVSVEELDKKIDAMLEDSDLESKL